MHELLDAHHALLAVGAQHAAIGDAVALLEALGLRADLDDHAGRLAADRVGHRRLVEARARIDVDEVEADRGVLDLHLAGAGRADLDVLELHLFRSAILMHQDRFRHFLLPVVEIPERPSAAGVEYSEGLRRVDCTDAKSSWLQPRHYPRLAAPSIARAQEILKSSKANYRLVTLARDLEQPWSIAFLPDGRILVTERPGRLRVFANGRLERAPLGGVPKVYARGQGGLLDVCLHPQFATNRVLYLSYSGEGPGGAATTVARAELGDGALRGCHHHLRGPAATPAAACISARASPLIAPA